jgi:hypothetical protein
MSIPIVNDNIMEVGQRNFLAAIMPFLLFALKVFTTVLGLVMFVVHMMVVIFFGTVNLFLRMVFH